MLDGCYICRLQATEVVMVVFKTQELRTSESGLW